MERLGNEPLHDSTPSANCPRDDDGHGGVLKPGVTGKPLGPTSLLVEVLHIVFLDKTSGDVQCLVQAVKIEEGQQAESNGSNPSAPRLFICKARGKNVSQHLPSISAPFHWQSLPVHAVGPSDTKPPGDLNPFFRCSTSLEPLPRCADMCRLAVPACHPNAQTLDERQ